MSPHRPRRVSLAAAQDGNAVLEFALIMPVFLMLVFGILDYGQMMYGQVLLNGAVRQAARGAAVEGGNTTTADNLVRNVVSPALPGATYTITRSAFVDFNDIDRAERFTDTNTNGRCDNSEPYTDENGDGSWNANIGASGNGGANDVVVYKVTAQYRPLFHIPLMPNQWSQVSLTSTAVKKNQPFAAQTSYGTATGTC